MYFQHSAGIWDDFPELAAGVLFASGIKPGANVDPAIMGYLDLARTRLAGAPESQWPEISAWRRVFARMGLKPTQYRCASESLLRRLRLDGSVPRSHPLVDLCNAISMAFGIPVAVFDTARIGGGVEVRRAIGTEEYLTFGGESEYPAPGEVIFADEADRAHARRWTNRQSGLSAVGAATSDVLIVAEAMHADAATDVHGLTSTLAGELRAWGATPASAVFPSPGSPRAASG